MNTLNTAVEIASEVTAPIVAEVMAPVAAEVVAPVVAEAMAPTVAKAVKPGAIKSLFRAAKRAPVKTTAIAVGGIGVIAGTVFLVKKVRKVRAANAEIEALVEDTKAETPAADA